MYKKMYFKLFNAITDALAQISDRNYGAASTILSSAQLETEEIYISWGETKNGFDVEEDDEEGEEAEENLSEEEEREARWSAGLLFNTRMIDIRCMLGDEALD